MPLVIRRPMDLSPSGPAIHATIMDHFLEVPPNFFTVEDHPKQRRRCLRPDPQRIISCTRSMSGTFLDSNGGCLKVGSEAELQSLTEKLLNLPIFLTALVRRHHKRGKVITIVRGHVAVVVNTQHVQIRHHFKTLLAEAMELMQKGKKFAIEFDFNHVMEEWLEYIFRTAGEKTWGSISYDSRHAKITVTNYKERLEMFVCRHCVTSTLHVFCWLMCFPCCMLICPLYRFQRALRVSDRGGWVPDELYATTFWMTIGNMDENSTRLAYEHLIQKAYTR